MGHALIWIESLAAALALLACVTAWTGRWSTRLRQRWLPILAAVVLISAAIGVTAACGYLRFLRRVETFPFYYPLSWTLALTASAVIVLIVGLRRRPSQPAPAAAAWSRGKLALTLAALVTVSCITLSNLDLAVKVELAALRTEAGARMLAGMPPRVPDRQNAALVYQQAFELLTPSETPPLWKDKDALAWIDYSSTAFDPRDDKLREFLDTQEPALALLRKAAAMPDCSVDRDYSRHIAMLFPELEKLRHGAMLLAYDAVSKAGHGEGPAAVHNVAAILGMARHIDDPLLIAMLTSLAVEKTGIRVLEDVLALVPPRPEDFAVLFVDENFSYQRYFQRCCQMEEAAMGLPLMAESTKPLFAGPPELAISLIFDLPIYRVFILPGDLAAYRQVMQQIQQLADQPYYQSHQEWDQLGQSWSTRRRGIVTSLITPGAERCAPEVAEGDALRQLMRLALAMATFRAKSGQYPNQLSDLVPSLLSSIQLDPFSGQPLQMKRDGQAIILYSIGRNLEDDGGEPSAPDKHDGDITFRLP